MKKFYFLFLFLLSFSTLSFTQVFDSSWSCSYATWDDQPNATGYNTPSVATIKPNTFVALVRRGTNNTNYLVGYRNATDSTGRLGSYGYGTSGVGTYRQPWSSGFDLVYMSEAMDIEATPDSLIFVANNDPDRNILVFTLNADSVVSTDFRLTTGTDSLYGIDLDDAGNVFVTAIRPGQPGLVKVFAGIAANNEWTSPTHIGVPTTTITMPDTGDIRGITVNPAGTVVYVSNFTLHKVYCFIGSPATGYQLYNGFQTSLLDTIRITDSISIKGGAWGLNYHKTKNLLSLAVASDFLGGDGYRMGRIYIMNPNTGAILDTIDCAEWNYLLTGSYQNRGNNGQQPQVSGYASPYYVDWDSEGGLYTVSYYGWTVDKWSYSGVLPTIPLTITGIEKNELLNPEQFSLQQNYPNPFNPSTSISFEIPEMASVSLKIFTINGELVSELINNVQYERGAYTLQFTADKLASGTYVYTLQAGANTISKKMTLIK